MMENDFSFPCGHAGIPDALFERFLDADPQTVFDPFPHIADREDFSQCRTQPLPRIYYWASTDPLNDILKVRHALKYGHEQAHINNDDTPAKRWARYLHGSRLQKIDTIVWAETWNTEAANSWDALREITTLLSAIGNRIRLSEELLATAESIIKTEQAVNTISAVAHWRKQLGYLEEEAFEYFEDEERQPQFLDFRTFYPVIKKVMTWAEFDESGYLDLALRIFLQGLSFSRKTGILAVDSHQQCKLIAEQVEGMDNPAQLSDWLTKMIRERNLFISGMVLDNLLAEGGKGTVTEALWQVTHRAPNSPEGLYGPLPEKVPFKFNNYLFDRSRVSVMLFPRLLDTHWYIQPVVLRPFGDDVRVETNRYLEAEPVMIVLKLEAILEQLLAGDGICCPYYRYSRDMPGACPCRSEWKRALSRILQWAREGKFGPDGTWRDLPPECVVAGTRR